MSMKVLRKIQIKGCVCVYVCVCASVHPVLSFSVCSSLLGLGLCPNVVPCPHLPQHVCVQA